MPLLKMSPVKNMYDIVFHITSSGRIAMSESRDKLESTISTLEAEAYWRGLEHGLQIAERIAGWLTWQPQSKRMAEIEKWAYAAIEEGRNLIPATPNVVIKIPCKNCDLKDTKFCCTLCRYHLPLNE